MTKLRTNPKQWTERLDNIINRLSDDFSVPDEDKTSKIDAWTNTFNTLKEEKIKLEQGQDFKINNLEYELRTTDWVIDKAKASRFYAQNLYAALCNNEFQKQDVWPIIKDQRWSCSWRYAGGIVSDMLEDGDYLDWYCSGIRESDHNPVDPLGRTYMGEGFVTDEIQADLAKLGWQIITTEE